VRSNKRVSQIRTFRVNCIQEAKMNHQERETVALFRLQVIGDLMVAGLSRDERRGLFKDKTNRVYAIPGSRRTRIAESTLRDWVRLYKHGGLDALKPPYRCDTSISRVLPLEIADKILALREEDQSRSVQTILTMLRHANITAASQLHHRR
jgi:transposase-like protein